MHFGPDSDKNTKTTPTDRVWTDLVLFLSAELQARNHPATDNTPTDTQPANGTGLDTTPAERYRQRGSHRGSKQQENTGKPGSAAVISSGG